jgi:hypothetical protein
MNTPGVTPVREGTPIPFKQAISGRKMIGVKSTGIFNHI